MKTKHVFFKATDCFINDPGRVLEMCKMLFDRANKAGLKGIKAYNLEVDVDPGVDEWGGFAEVYCTVESDEKDVRI